MIVNLSASADHKRTEAFFQQPVAGLNGIARNIPAQCLQDVVCGAQFDLQPDFIHGEQLAITFCAS
ncbi:MAG: hypothetical protein ACM3TN_25120 [Alphaproteobacteria bacterium]